MLLLDLDIISKTFKILLDESSRFFETHLCQTIKVCDFHDYEISQNNNLKVMLDFPRIIIIDFVGPNHL